MTTELYSLYINTLCIFTDQLVELRTVLEKIRPIDQKLKYQVDKLVRNASDGKVEADPLRHRANLDNLDEVHLKIQFRFISFND